MCSERYLQILMMALCIRSRRNYMPNSREHLVLGDHDKSAIFVLLLFSGVRYIFVISSPKQIFVQCRDYMNVQVHFTCHIILNQDFVSK
jgi:hypothetical protein